MQPFNRFHSHLFNSSLALIQISRKCRPDSCETQHIQTNIRTLIKFGVLCRKTYAERYNSFGMEVFERISFLASFGPPGTGRTEGGEKTQPFKLLPSRLFTYCMEKLIYKPLYLERSENVKLFLKNGNNC